MQRLLRVEITAILGCLEQMSERNLESYQMHVNRTIRNQVNIGQAMGVGNGPSAKAYISKKKKTAPHFSAP